MLHRDIKPPAILDNRLTSRSRSKLAAALVAAMLLVTHPSAAKATTYANPVFGFTLELPKGLAPCETADDADDHGLIVPLDPRDAESCSDNTSRNISIFAWTRHDTATLQELLKSECDLAGSCVAAPDGLRVADYKSTSYRVDHDDSWIDIVVLTQGDRSGHGPAHGQARPVNYSVKLYTDKAHLTHDLVLFKAVLRTIQLRSAAP
jgi:hypothetical protein